MDIVPRSSGRSEAIYPVVAIRDGIVFPTTENVLLFGRKQSVQAIKAGLIKNKYIVLLMQKSPSTDNPLPKDLYEIGVLVSIKKLSEGDKGEITALLRGEKRVKIVEFIKQLPFFEAKVKVLEEISNETDETKALVKHIRGELKKAINLGKGIDIVFLMNIMSGASTTQFSEQIAMILDLKSTERQKLLEEPDLNKRLKMESDLISKEVKILQIEKNIHVKTQKKFEKGMKDTVLREKLKTIEQELGGEQSGEEKEIRELRAKIKKAKMTTSAEKKALKELGRLARMSSYNPEASYIRTYLDWLIEIPWMKKPDSDITIKKAEKILNEDHYGLNKVKERILEYLAVLRLKKETLKEARFNRQKKTEVKQPTILCFVGPPGVGKTSIGRSIARALGRKFVKVSLGGIRDEAEIRGHRRTYVGALPGRVIQGIKQAGTRNPVFMLDEIDKIGRDYRGDPSSALLEALDPEQNHSFSDHYLEVEYDLSDVMFITTANILDTIPDALRDRLEIIHFAGYTEDEKFNIGKNFLIKKQLEAHGLSSKQVHITNDALKLIIRRYTREAGVRGLERQIAKALRKIAREIIEKKHKKRSVGKVDITKYLGPYKFSDSVIEDHEMTGISTGLAWTQAGGDILFIEVAIMPGKSKLSLTGQLGDVMKESCRAALSYVRSRWKVFGLEKDFYSKIDIHVHVPEGSVPKDGPSAGIAITTAMISALTNVPVNRYVGMTGEITLRGRVMEIGGVKEKVIAAHRAGIKTVILPKDNKKDLEDIPDYVINDIKFEFVDHMDTVLKKALVLPKQKIAFQFAQKTPLNGNGQTRKLKKNISN